MRVYLVLVAVSFLSGYGILAALGLGRALNGALLAAPGVALTLLILVVGNGVWFGASIALLAKIVAAAALLLSAFGAVALVKAPPPRRDWIVAALAAACPLIVLFSFFRWSLT